VAIQRRESAGSITSWIGRTGAEPAQVSSRSRRAGTPA
jgi:hypothetical protein